MLKYNSFTTLKELLLHFSSKSGIVSLLLTPFILLWFSTPGLSAAPGFKKGGSWEFTLRQGIARYTCQNGSVSVPTSQDCSEKLLLPASQDYFYHSPMSTGNQVRLTTQHNDGWVGQTRPWNKSTGLSMTPFELYDPNQASNSLLQMGVNKIYFSILQNNEVVERGFFEVTVAAGQPQVCDPLYLGVIDPNDYYRCLRDQRICQDYLHNLATCHP